MSYDSSPLRLDGENTSLLITCPHSSSVPQLIWCGEKLATGITQAQLEQHANTALPHATVDKVVPLTLLPEASKGYMGAPALSGHRSGGAFAHRFKLVEQKQFQNKIEIVLADELAQLRTHLQLRLEQNSDVVTLQCSLENSGDDDYFLEYLASATLPLPDNYTDCVSFHGRWGLENQSQRRSIGFGRIDISNLHGRTSHEHAPGIMCGTANFNEQSGDVMFMQLAWSGNCSWRIERLSDNSCYAQAGVLFGPGEKILAPGETYTCPPVLFCRANSTNSCTQRFHQHARKHILPQWTRSARPVHANSWEAMYFDLDTESLCSLIDAAAQIGAERFILDDGWFVNRRDDTRGLGDWTVDTSVFPDRLDPVVKQVRSHGMQFGLWFEPEMINPDSNLYRNHPEWVLHVDGIDTPLARNQLALDISRDDVSDYLFSHITKLVHEYKIDYIKWDMNRDLVLAGDGDRCKCSSQPEALYRLLQRINANCPALEIETCSSGGARTDFGILAHTGRVWTSDNIDPIDRAKIQQGFLRFMPPEIMGSHVGHEHAHLTGRATSLHTRAIMAMQGQFGFELDARKLELTEHNTLKHYTDNYKQHRDWISQATYWQLPTPEEALLASGVVAEDQTQALYTIIATQSLKTTRPGVIALLGLKPDGLYKVSLLSCNLEELKPFNKEFPQWCMSSISTTGELLQTLCLPLPVMPTQTALLVHCEQEEKA